MTSAPRETWTGLLEAGWHPPYVALVQSGPEGNERFFQSGSGIVVADRYILTCLHVLLPPEDCPRTSTSTELPSFMQEYQKQRTRETRARLLGGPQGWFDLECVAEDRRNDLALLKIPSPLVGLAPPMARLASSSIPDGGQDANILGIMFDGQPRFARQVIMIDPRLALYVSGRRVEFGHAQGAQGGFSGGPVFLDIDGKPCFLGLARLGGDGTAVGRLIASDIIHEFLRPHISPSDDSFEHPHKSRCLLRGIRPEIDLAGKDLGAPLPRFYWVPGERDAGAVFVSKTPVAASLVDLLSGKQPPRIAEKLPAHVQGATEVAALIRKLSEKTGVPLRLPTPREWKRFQETADIGVAPARATRRPATLADFTIADGRPRRAPTSVLEWLHEPRGPALFETESGDPVPVDADRLRHGQGHERAVARLAFDAGWRNS